MEDSTMFNLPVYSPQLKHLRAPGTASASASAAAPYNTTWGPSSSSFACGDTREENSLTSMPSLLSAMDNSTTGTHSFSFRTGGGNGVAPSASLLNNDPSSSSSHAATTGPTMNRHIAGGGTPPPFARSSTTNIESSFANDIFLIANPPPPHTTPGSGAMLPSSATFDASIRGPAPSSPTTGPSRRPQQRPSAALKQPNSSSKSSSDLTQQEYWFTGQPTTMTSTISLASSSSPVKNSSSPTTQSSVTVRTAAIHHPQRNLSPFAEGSFLPMLPLQHARQHQRVTLALDLDETLVHAISIPAITNAAGGSTVLQFTHDHLRSKLYDGPITMKSLSSSDGGSSSPSNKPTSAELGAILERFRANSDFVVHIGKGEPNEEVIFVKHRPYVHEFLAFVAEKFEVVFFTASRACYADPVLDHLLSSVPRKLKAGGATPQSSLAASAASSISSLPRLRLYREHCAEVGTAKVKDLSLLGRPLHRIAIIDNLATSFMFQPRNGVLIKSYFGEADDTELRTMLPMLEQLASSVDVVGAMELKKY